MSVLFLRAGPADPGAEAARRLPDRVPPGGEPHRSQSGVSEESLAGTNQVLEGLTETNQVLEELTETNQVREGLTETNQVREGLS